MLDISPTEWTAIQLSLRVPIVATLVATPLGIALAWLLARRDFWGKAALDALIHLPLVLPPVVTGYLLLLTFGRRWPAASCRFRCWYGRSGCRSRRSTGGWSRRQGHWEPRPGKYFGPSRCRWHCRACWPGWCSALPRRSANSAPPSPSCRIFPAKP